MSSTGPSLPYYGVYAKNARRHAKRSQTMSHPCGVVRCHYATLEITNEAFYNGLICSADINNDSFLVYNICIRIEHHQWQKHD